MTNRGPSAGLDRYGEVIGLLKTAVQAGREDLANELARALLNKGTTYALLGILFMAHICFAESAMIRMKLVIVQGHTEHAADLGMSLVLKIQSMKDSGHDVSTEVNLAINILQAIRDKHAITVLEEYLTRLKSLRTCTAPAELHHSAAESTRHGGDMPLVNCPECGRQISTSADACPQCGYPMCAHTAAHVPTGPKCYQCSATATTRCQNCNAFSCVLHLQSTSAGRGKSYVREMRCESCRWWAHFETVFFIVAVAIIIVAIYVFVVVLNPNHPSNH
jgi:hypothetical protein